MTQIDPVTAIRKEQEIHGRQMAQREQRSNNGHNNGQKRYDFKKQDRNKSQKPAGRKYEGHEAELHEAIKQGLTVHLIKETTGKPFNVSGVILDMDKFAIKLRVKTNDPDGVEGEGDFWFYKHAFEAISIVKEA